MVKDEKNNLWLGSICYFQTVVYVDPNAYCISLQYLIRNRYNVRVV